jgi:TRAP-type mannitol/chloroaromatic compound transport system permease small subunit
MGWVLRVTDAIEGFVGTIGRFAGWLILLLVAITMFDVMTRHYFAIGIGSAAIQEMEWHLHTALFALCLGYAYLRNAHVRIEILRERFSVRARAWIEFLGCAFLLVPYAMVTIYYGYHFVAMSFAYGERSTSPAGLCCRWIIKGVLLSGLVLLLLAGLAVLLRHALFLFGPRQLRERLLDSPQLR